MEAWTAALLRLVLPAVVLAVLEMVALLLAGHTSRSLSGLALVSFRFALGVCLWVVLLALASMAIRIGTGAGSAVAVAVRATVFVGLFLALLVDVASLGLMAQTESFVGRDLLSFGLSNLAQLNLHLLQTVSAVWFSVLGGSLVGALVLGWLLGRTTLPMRVLVVLLAVAGGLVVLGILLAWMTGQTPRAVASRTHPFLAAAISGGEKPEELVSTEGPELEPRQEAALDVYGDANVTMPVIVIIVESLRHDILENDPCPMPFVASLRESSLVLRRPYAVSSHSDYEDLSVWYSRYPLRGRGRTTYAPDAPSRGDSIFKIFKLMGYRTAYISSQNEKWGGMINWLRVPEVDTFFHSEDYNGPTWENEDDKDGLVRLIRARVATAGKVEDGATLTVAGNWVAALPRGTPFLLGMNLQNTHFNYVIPEGGPEPFQPSVIDFPTPFYTWPRERVVDVRNRYLNACYNLDLALRGFAERLKGMGIWDRAMVVILGDSGEAFYEHGFGNHSGPLYEEAVRTVGLIKVPLGMPGGVVETPVSHIDVLPTVLSLLGVPVPGSFQGVPVDQAGGRRQIFMLANALARQDGIIDWPWKLLVSRAPRLGEELYNLEEDPAEAINRAPEERQQVLRLRACLSRFRALQLGYYGDPRAVAGYHPPKP